ncbi:MAG: orotidine-5'-phosphate decarboxylase [Candidatus Levybacteria bacterium]|nr:orotidine-5'-phosphate decarboxylase [Candidatus Levybacteria bacterium]
MPKKELPPNNPENENKSKSNNEQIIDATCDLVCAYKPNIAFYEAQGTQGLEALSVTIDYIRDTCPDVPVILDAKRADIGNTNLGYVEAAFDHYGADAVTVHPYLGKEALKPFLDRKDKGIIVLVKTSNPGADEFQDLFVSRFTDVSTTRMYEYVAKRVSKHWNENGNVGVVVGATYPHHLEYVRKIVGDMPILIPGIGAQGGEVEETVKAGMDNRGWGMIINSSRGIIFASKQLDFAEAARRETEKLRNHINEIRQAV